jgi:hypothetical protein
LTPRDIQDKDSLLVQGDEESFKVFVRVRPLNDRELYFLNEKGGSGN